MRLLLSLLLSLIVIQSSAGVYNYSSLDFINQGTGQVGRNYIKNAAAEVNSIGWSTFADAASTTPTDGTGGSPNSTWARTTSSPLRGAGSFLWTKSSGASRQGEGVSYDFTIDAADKGKVLQISFDYAIASGTFVDDDMTVWVYDVTNAALIQPAPYKLKNHSLAAEKFGLEFQTATSSTSYRLILFVPVTTNSSNTLKFDNFSVGPQAKLYGSPVTDWISYTPTGSWVANSTYTGYWRRVGDQMEVNFRIALSGAPTAASLTVNLPSGYTIDTSKITALATTVVGVGNIDESAGNSNIGARINYNSTTSVTVNYIRLSGSLYDYPGVNATTPVTFGNTDNVSGTFLVPISGWSSSAIMSSDADTRVVALELSGTSTSVTSSTVDIVPTTVVQDTHGGMSSATYTVKVPGFYNIAATIRSASSAWTQGQSFFVYYSINGADVELGFSYAHTTASFPLGASGSAIKYLNAGDTVKFRVYAGVTGTPGAFRASINKISGPAQIAASDTVAARATGDPASATSGNPIIVPTVSFDSTGSYSGSTGKLTCPVSGTYSVSGALSSASSATTLTIYVNSASDALAGNLDSNGEATFYGLAKCLAGQTLDIRPGGTVDATSMTINFERVGNY